MKHLFPETVFSRITTVLENTFAFHVTKTRWGEIEKAILEAAAASGRPPGLVAELAAEAACPADILDMLVRHVTVGETYFFRHPEQFLAVEKSILPRLVGERRASGTKRLAFWSAGCSSGEEAYSLAILVAKTIPDYADWDISIVASDINGRSLETAGTGTYREWSFRGLDEAFKSMWFDVAAHEPGLGEYSQLFVIKPEIRRMVKFLSLNLAQASWSAPDFPALRFDIVFCRNVLMYFPRSMALDILRHLRLHMANGACLAVAPSEASMAHAAGFGTLRFSDCSLFLAGEEKRAHEDKPAPQTKANRATTVAAAAPLAQHHHHGTQAIKPPVAAILPPQPFVPTTQTLAQQAHAAADSGNLDRAWELVRQALAQDPTDPAAHYLHAVMSMEKGNFDEAHDSLTRTLFLHPDYVPALIAIGNVTRRLGRHVEATRHFRNAVQVLEAMEPSAIIPESEGITAGSLLQMAKALREVKKQS